MIGKRPAQRRIIVSVAIGLLGLTACATSKKVALPTLSARPTALPGDPPASASAEPSPTTQTATLKTPVFPGLLLIADRGNDRALLVDGRKHIIWTYPPPGTKPSMPFNYDDDTFFTPGFGSIISNQEDQQTIEEISFPGGHVMWHYGHVDHPGSRPGFLHTPDDAYRLPDGRTVVADVDNCRILFMSASAHYDSQIGTTGVCAHNPPHALDSPNGDTPLPDGGILITEIHGSWVDAISKTGHLEWSVHAPVAYPSDAQWLGNGTFLLADYSTPGHVLIMNTKGHVLWKYGPDTGGGALDHPSLALPLPGGLIAVNDDFRHRVILIDKKTKKIVWQYGQTDHQGRSPGLLNTPDGMDFLPADVAAKMPVIVKASAAAWKRAG